MRFNQRRTLMKTLIESQFGYYLIFWMFHGRIVNKKINQLHERVLRIVYKDYTSCFKDLLTLSFWTMLGWLLVILI